MGSLPGLKSHASTPFWPSHVQLLTTKMSPETTHFKREEHPEKIASERKTAGEP